MTHDNRASPQQLAFAAGAVAPRARPGHSARRHGASLRPCKAHLSGRSWRATSISWNRGSLTVLAIKVSATEVLAKERGSHVFISQTKCGHGGVGVGRNGGVRPGTAAIRAG